MFLSIIIIHTIVHITEKIYKKKKDKLQNWSLSFITYLNLVHNLSIVSIWSLTFLVPCKFCSCHYLFDGKNDMLNEIIINYFPCHINCQLYCHIRLFYNKKIQIKICTQYHLTKIYFFLVSPSQYHLHLFTPKKINLQCAYNFSFSFLAAKHN